MSHFNFTIVKKDHQIVRIWLCVCSSCWRLEGGGVLGYDQSGTPLHCNPFGLNYSAKFVSCTIVGLNVTLVEATIRTWDT